MLPKLNKSVASIVGCFIVSSSVLFLLWKEERIYRMTEEGGPKHEQTQHVLDDTTKLWLTGDLHGRLGNLLFKYASLLGIGKATGRHAFILREKKVENWKDIFNVTHVETRDPASIKGWKQVTEAVWSNWDPVFQQLPNVNVTIQGYLQSWKYFDHVKEDIRREFAFQPHIRVRVEEIKEKIRQTFEDKDDLVFIGVHVRRRDALSSKATTNVPKSYYINAFETMAAIQPGKHLVYLIACVDQEWCNRFFNQMDHIVLEDAPAEIHLAVLASCRHVILSVGSFGWWAGWLSGGEVIYYKNFPPPWHHASKGFKAEDYYPPNWIGVE